RRRNSAKRSTSSSRARSCKVREVSDHIDALSAMVTDNREASRFELVLDGDTAVLQYTRTPQSLVLVHTEVPPSLRGRHLADALAKAAIEDAHAEGLQVVAVCPFVRAYLQRHPESEGTPALPTD